MTGPALIPFAPTSLDCVKCNPQMHAHCGCRALCAEHRAKPELVQIDVDDAGNPIWGYV
jgi:hypothetical protein